MGLNLINYTTNTGLSVPQAYCRVYVKDIVKVGKKTIANVIYNVFASKQANENGLASINPNVSPLQVEIDVNIAVHKQAYMIAKEKAAAIAGSENDYNVAVSAYDAAIAQNESAEGLEYLTKDMDEKHKIYLDLKRFEIFIGATDVFEEGQI